MLITNSIDDIENNNPIMLLKYKGKTQFQLKETTFELDGPKIIHADQLVIDAYYIVCIDTEGDIVYLTKTKDQSPSIEKVYQQFAQTCTSKEEYSKILNAK